MKSQSLINQDSQNTQLFQKQWTQGQVESQWQKNTLFAYSHVYYTGIAAYTNTKEWQYMANTPLQ